MTRYVSLITYMTIAGIAATASSQLLLDIEPRAIDTAAEVELEASARYAVNIALLEGLPLEDAVSRAASDRAVQEGTRLTLEHEGQCWTILVTLDENAEAVPCW